MKTPFLITGLPRSRTAWLANLLTTDKSLCAHEGTTEGPQVLIEWLRAPGLRGNADSGMPMHWDLMREAFPDARVVLIKRDMNEAFDSWARFLKRGGMAFNRTLLQHRHDQAGAALQRIENEPGVLVIPFDELNDSTVIKWIWYHCIPEVEFNRERVSFLQRLNVQQELSAVIV